MRAQEIIRKKRDSETLDRAEMDFMVEGIASGRVPDYQASAFLMSVFLNGMSMEETVHLTRAMMASGKALDTGGLLGAVVDKHSTGGVGDKTSIVLAPLLAVMGVKVPMVSGRGLGHTGGTLDKLQSIPGFRVDLPVKEYMEILKNLGAFFMGQTSEFVPADKKLYALRDVTSTVESIPLIASSIMSKKLSEGVKGLLLDVKTGSGAFMSTPKQARMLASTMVGIGRSMGVKTVALITDMDQPLGRTVGNALEVKECISALRGKGPADLMELTLTLAAWMLNIADAVSEDTAVKSLKDFSLNRYKNEAMEFIDKGDAFKRFAEIIDAQHGDPEVVFSPKLLPLARHTKHILAGSEGYIRKLNARAVGQAAMLLGAGRSRAEDVIDHAAGIILNSKVGDFVKADEPVAMFHYNEEGLLGDAEEAFMLGLEIGERDTAKRPLVFEAVMEP